MRDAHHVVGLELGSGQASKPMNGIQAFCCGVAYDTTPCTYLRHGVDHRLHVLNFRHGLGHGLLARGHVLEALQLPEVTARSLDNCYD